MNALRLVTWTLCLVVSASAAEAGGGEEPRTAALVPNKRLFREALASHPRAVSAVLHFDRNFEPVKLPRHLHGPRSRVLHWLAVKGAGTSRRQLATFILSDLALDAQGKKAVLEEELAKPRVNTFARRVAMGALSMSMDRLLGEVEAYLTRARRVLAPGAAGSLAQRLEALQPAVEQLELAAAETEAELGASWKRIRERLSRLTGKIVDQSPRGTLRPLTQ
jgi:hypothetical protein